MNIGEVDRIMNVNEDRFVHKQFPYVRESVVRSAGDAYDDYETLIQYLRDQGIEVRG